MTYWQMAEVLKVSPDCIKAHVSNMLSRTGYNSKTKLAAMVMSKRRKKGARSVKPAPELQTQSGKRAPGL